MQKARRHTVNVLRPLVGVRFQDLFHSLIQGSFHLSLTVLVHYRSLRSIQPYRMVPVDSDRVSRAPPYSGYCYHLNTLPLRDYHPLWFIFPDNSSSVLIKISQSYNPKTAATVLVWALPLSLAATHRITIVLLSSGYLDVSVHRVRSVQISLHGDWSSTRRVAPFGHLRINSWLPIPAAFRSLSRPSSPLRAQASPIRS